MPIANLVQMGALELCLSQILYRYNALPQTFDVSECPSPFCPLPVYFALMMLKGKVAKGVRSVC